MFKLRIAGYNPLSTRADHRLEDIAAESYLTTSLSSKAKQSLVSLHERIQAPRIPRIPAAKASAIASVRQQLLSSRFASTWVISDTNEADHPRGMLSDRGGVVSQALALPLPDGSSRNRGHADTRHPWQGDHPRVAKHASGDSMAIDTDSSLVACGAILHGAGASASTPQEQLLPHAGTGCMPQVMATYGSYCVVSVRAAALSHLEASVGYLY